MTTTYLVSSLLWFAGGLFAGYLVGRAGDEREASVNRTRWWRQLRGDTVVGVIVLLVAMGSTLLVVQQSAALHRATECQQLYNAAFADALEARTEAARLERDSQRRLLTAILQNAGDQAAGRAALDAYLADLDRADREREGAPLPANDCQPR